jgi:hypothetical protein
MPNPLQTGHSLESSLRRQNADGTVTIVCRLCGRQIIRAMYQGFSTAVCTECSTGQAPGVVQGAVMMPDGRLLYQADANITVDAVLYSEEPQKEKMGLARAVFCALGFGRKKTVPAPVEKSREVSKSKRRKPLFGPEESDND